MYRIDGCVSSPLIQHMCKSVQSSFDNCSINTVYSCTLKLKWFGKGLLSLTKYGPISRIAVFLVYNASSHKAAIVREYLIYNPQILDQTGEKTLHQMLLNAASDQGLHCL